MLQLCGGQCVALTSNLTLTAFSPVMPKKSRIDHMLTCPDQGHCSAPKRGRKLQRLIAASDPGMHRSTRDYGECLFTYVRRQGTAIPLPAPKPDIYMVSRKLLLSAFLVLELGGGALSGEAWCLQAALHHFGEGYCVL